MRTYHKNPRRAKKKAAEEYVRTLYRIRNLQFKYRLSAAWHILLAGHRLRSLPPLLWSRCPLPQRLIFFLIIITATYLGVIHEW